MKKIRVVVVDDSSFCRSLLRDILEHDAGIEVVGEACDGAQAVRLAVELKPDLMTMDLSMPVMNGHAAIAEIMAVQALPILVVSDLADASNACEAVALGALDVMPKPAWDDASMASFVAKIKLLANVRVITHLRSSYNTRPIHDQLSRSLPAPTAGPQEPTSRFESGASQRIIAIACSTGGPQALAQILGQLPSDFPCPILVSQHISDGFAAGLCEWLASFCKLPVRLAQEGDLVQPGTITISPSERNLAVAPTRRLTLQARRSEQIFHPVCDVLLASVASVYGKEAVGLILTGMSSDGVIGIARIHQAGGITLAQDEASSVVFGMNQKAIDSGKVQQVLALDQIAASLCSLARSRRGES